MTINEAIENASKIQGWFPEEDMRTVWNLVIGKVPEGGLVVEMGSWKGRSSYIFAAACQEKKANLICMDSFKGLLLKDHKLWDLYQSDNGYYAEGNQGSIIHHIKDNLKEFNNVEIRQGDSRDLHKTIKDESVDLFFLDGDHDMPILGLDLDNFYPKVKKGGYFCGHDYAPGNNVSEGVDPRFPMLDLYNTIWGVTK